MADNLILLHLILNIENKVFGGLENSKLIQEW